MNTYIMGVVYAAAAAAVVMAAAPKGWPKTLLGILSGLVLTAVICGPIANVNFDGLNVEISDGDAEFARYMEEQSKLLKELIAEKTSAYILTKAQALGIRCEARVEAGGDPPRPERAWVTGGPEPPGHMTETLAAILCDELGIPRERQYYSWEPVSQGSEVTSEHG